MARLSRNGEKRVKKKKKPQFFTVIVNPALQLLKLRLPKKFVRNHGNNLPDCAYLRAPNGIDWLVEILKCDGEIWLQRGWKQFAEYYFLASGNVIVFKYNGKIRTFRVLIFDSNTNLEINYPNNHNLHQNAKEIEDDSSTEMFDEIQHQSEDKSSYECTEASSCNMKARAFVGDGPGFIINMSKSYIELTPSVPIPAVHSKKYLKDEGKEHNVICIHGKDGRTWKLNYSFQESYPRILSSGWKKFRFDNHLKIGDKCAFKLIDGTKKAYNVVIFRVKGK